MTRIKTNSIKTSSLITIFSVAAGSFGFSPAQADSASLLDEIIVTAQKREKSMQDVPISITAFTEGVLEAYGITNTADIAQFTPGLTIPEGGGGGDGETPISIRGIGSFGSLVGADEAVGVYIDGVAIPRSGGMIFDLVDIERIEVLRGPQGTLFGRNATAGVISVVTKKPSDELEGFVEGTYGKFNEIRLRGSVSAPIGDKSGFRIGGTYTNRGGHGTNVIDSSEVNDIESYSVRGSLAFELSEALDVFLTADYGRMNDVSVRKDISGQVAGPQGDATEYNTFENNEVDAIQERDNFGLSATITYNLESVIIKSITGYRDFKNEEIADADGSAVPFLRFHSNTSANSFTEELQLISNSDSQLSWIGGLFYFHENSSFDALVTVFGGAALVPMAFENTTESIAGYGEATFDVTDKLSVTGGLRYTHETKDSLSGVAAVPGNNSWDSWTPKTSIDYRWNDMFMTYISAAKGYKSGGFNAAGVDPSFDQETVWQYEVGFKSSLLDNKVRLNASVFSSDYNNLQVRVPITAGQIIILNAATADIKGVEIELNARPSDQFGFDITLAYLDAKYDTFDSPIFNPNTGEQTGTDSFAGNRLNRAPEWQFSIAAYYDIELPSGARLTPRFSYSYETEIFYTNENLVGVSSGAGADSGSHGSLDARLVYRDADDRFKVIFWGKSLTNDRYWTGVLPVAAGLVAAPNEPLSYGVTASVSF